MTLRSQVAVGLKWKAISIVGRQLLSFVVFTTLARLLNPSAFGLAGLVSVYLGFVGMFADQGIGTALVQRRHLDPGHVNTAFWFNVACAFALCLGTVVLAGPVSLLFGEPKLAPLLRVSSLNLVISAVASIHGTLFYRDMDFRRPALRILVANGAGGVVGVVMAFLGCGVWALVGQQLAASIGGAAFLWAASGYRPQWQYSYRHLRDLFKVSTSVLATSILWFLSSRLDQIVIGRFAGVPALGFYMIGGKLPDMAKIVTHDPMADVSLPALARLQGDHRKMCDAIYRGMEMNALVCFAIFIGLAAVAPDLIPLLFGAKWAAAAVTCSLLSVYALVNAVQVFFHPSLLASGGAGRYLLLNVWHTTGVLVACAVGIHWGVNDLVIGLILNGLVVSVPALLFLRKRIGLDPGQYLRPCLAPALAAAFMVAAIWVLGRELPAGAPGAVRLAAKVGAGAVVYLACIYAFGRRAAERLAETLSHAFHRRVKVPAALA